MKNKMMEFVPVDTVKDRHSAEKLASDIKVGRRWAGHYVILIHPSLLEDSRVAGVFDAVVPVAEYVGKAWDVQELPYHHAYHAALQMNAMVQQTNAGIMFTRLSDKMQDALTEKRERLQKLNRWRPALPAYMRHLTEVEREQYRGDFIPDALYWSPHEIAWCQHENNNTGVAGVRLDPSIIHIAVPKPWKL